MTNLDVIVEKITELKQVYHKDISYKPVDENELIEFEKRHNIHLPEEYRTFLLVVGTGFLVMPYEEFSYKPNWPDSLSLPFPYTKSTPEENCEDVDHSGILYFAYAGCGMAYFIVVSGAEYGNVWLDDTPNCNGVAPMPFPSNYFNDPEIERIRTENRTRMSFYQWIEAELDNLITTSRQHQQFPHLFTTPPPADPDAPF